MKLSKSAFDKFLDKVDWQNQKEKLAATEVVQTLVENPQVFHRIEPPAGYEQILLQGLREKLNLPERSASPTRNTFSAKPRAWWQLRPAFAWGLVGSLSFGCAMLALQVYEGRRTPTPTGIDLIALAAKQSDQSSVNRWLASVGDSTLRMKAGADLHALSWEISEKSLSRVRALEN